MQNSKIEWCTHSFNPWWGCQRVSPGCEHCYAETLAHRYKHDVWGPPKTTGRRAMSDNYWKQPYRWNAAALKQPYGTERPRVFCASMADVFEVHEQVAAWRVRLWETIGACDAMDWLLLTKRPQNVLPLVPPAWAAGYWPPHVWIGTSCEDQRRADERIPELLKIPAATRFLSCEPLLGPIELPWCKWCGGWCCQDCYELDDAAIHWCIVGGESGHGARPMHPDWARSLRDQCQDAGVAFHFKQWGEHVPYEWTPGYVWRSQHGDKQEQDGRTFAEMGIGRLFNTKLGFARVGKHAAGRLLDGRTWDEVPQ